MENKNETDKVKRTFKRKNKDKVVDEKPLKKKHTVNKKTKNVVPTELKMNASQISDIKDKAKAIKNKNIKSDNNLKKDTKDDEVKKVIVERKVGFNTLEVIVIIIISILFGAVLGGVLTYTKKSVTVTKVPSELKEFVSTYDNIVDNYYKDVDKNTLLDAAIKGMIDSLGDDYSTYFDSTESEEFTESVSGNYNGIGATVSTINNQNQIVGLFDKSPAKKAGLKVGDIFQKVDDTDVTSLSITDLTNLIKGDENTKVSITVLRGTESLTFKVVRGTIEVPSVSGKVIESKNNRVGYIYVSSFSSNTYIQFEEELTTLEKDKINSLIIDLRSNPGGHLTQVSSMLSLFLPKSKIMYQLETKGVKEPVYSYNNDKKTYPIVVLINSGSASASEIMAAGLQESYSKCLVVGVNSYGKGTVQQAYNLTSGSSLKFTTQKWLTPKGNSINEVGVTPDFGVELNSEYYNNPSDDNDNQLQKALDLITNKESFK